MRRWLLGEKRGPNKGIEGEKRPKGQGSPSKG